MSAAEEPGKPATVDRIVVLDGGHCTVEDLGPWSPGVHEGKPGRFSNPVVVIEHRGTWMVWDTGLDESLATTPGGEVFAHGVRGLVDRPLSDQLSELEIDPDEVQVMAFSHAHFDHVGNSRLFGAATWYVQRAEREAMFGPDPQRYGFIPELYDAMAAHETVLLDGDCDVFDDGAVTILSTPGHTPGHQSLLVRLSEAGPVIFSGDCAHSASNLRHRRIPTFNADKQASRRSMDRLVELVDSHDAQLMITHDAAQAALVGLAPHWIR